MENRKIYKCFISSPGDCNQERELCEKVIKKVNNGLAKHLEINFETFKWENDVLPDMGKNGQEIIDESVERSNYDIFIGIMRYRFGTPTKIAGSGTEHEFIKSIEKKKTVSEIKIIFFFNNEDINPKNFDSEEYQKVQDFKRRIGPNGLYIDYSGVSDFETKFEEKLNLFVKEVSSKIQPQEKIELIDKIHAILESDLKNSLKSFNEGAAIWIDPIISSKSEVPRNPSKNIEYQININTIIKNPESIIIRAPSEFGLTSLSHFLKLEAWKVGKTFIYIDAKATKKHKIIKQIQNVILSDYKKTLTEIDAIIIDSVHFDQPGILKMVKNASDAFPQTPIIIMNTTDSDLFITTEKEDENIIIERQFKNYYLLPLPQSEIRKVINEYSLAKTVEEDSDIILTKVTNDLEVLNMHRTVKNCLSILKASSKMGIEYNAINRTKLLDTILFTIFEEYTIPTYKSKKPDIKDCTFVIGYFCELLIKRNNFEFSEDFFKKRVRDFCDINYIELDTNYLFQVLIDNSIISTRLNSFYFKNAYWVFYFTAHRMNLNKEFKGYVFREQKYVDFPEIIEFYTGIDRNKEDALEVLLKDIKETLAVVNSKVQLPANLNPYNSISWTPDINVLEKEEEKISKNVISSGLPDEVKDKYNDNKYNQIRPYNQVINTVMREYSFLILMRQIAAGSRALRNSDFVNTELKKEFLGEILLGWNEVSKLLIVLTPILADKGNVAYDGARFILDEEDFTIDNMDEKRFAVLLAVPKNVVDYFKNDIFSHKMGPLLCDKALSETNSLLKHELMTLIVSERPKNWNIVVDKYIVNLDKNSFFLCDISSSLNTQFEYHVTEVSERRILGNLMHKCRAKHYFNDNNPSLSLINKARKQTKNEHF